MRPEVSEIQVHLLSAGKEVKENMNLFEEFRRSIVKMTIDGEDPEIQGIDMRPNLGRLFPWRNEAREEDQNQKEELGLLHS